jgi:integrase/recombinase XerD
LGELWLDALAAERGVSDGALKAHNEDLDCYLGYLARFGVGLADVSRQTVTDYLAFLDERGYAHTTVEGRRAVIRGLHRFLQSEKTSGPAMAR